MKKLILLVVAIALAAWFFIASPTIQTAGQSFWELGGTIVLIRCLAANILFVAAVWVITLCVSRRDPQQSQQSRPRPIWEPEGQQTAGQMSQDRAALQSVAEWFGFGLSELNNLRKEFTPIGLALALSFFVQAQTFHDLDAYGLQAWTPVVYLWFAALLFTLLIMNLGWAGTLALFFPPKIEVPGTNLEWENRIGEKFRRAIIFYFAMSEVVWLFNYLINTGGMNSAYYWAFLAVVSGIALWGTLARNKFRFRLWWAFHVFIGVGIVLIMLFQYLTKQQFTFPTLTTLGFVVFLVVGGGITIFIVSKLGGRENPDPHGAAHAAPAAAARSSSRSHGSHIPLWVWVTGIAVIVGGILYASVGYRYQKLAYAGTPVQVSLVDGPARGYKQAFPILKDVHVSNLKLTADDLALTQPDPTAATASNNANNANAQPGGNVADEASPSQCKIQGLKIKTLLTGDSYGLRFTQVDGKPLPEFIPCKQLRIRIESNSDPALYAWVGGDEEPQHQGLPNISHTTPTNLTVGPEGGFLHLVRTNEGTEPVKVSVTF